MATEPPQPEVPAEPIQPPPEVSPPDGDIDIPDPSTPPITPAPGE